VSKQIPSLYKEVSLSNKDIKKKRKEEAETGVAQSKYRV
jgi:hypothetical protein